MTANDGIKEMSMEQMDRAAGGASRYDRLPDRDGFMVYRVQSGETLWKIARKFGFTVEELMAWNPKITDRNCVYANEEIYIRL